jgi:hypothetical protein
MFSTKTHGVVRIQIKRSIFETFESVDVFATDVDGNILQCEFFCRGSVLIETMPTVDERRKVVEEVAA